MTNPHITLEGVSYVLPDGRTLFSDLNDTFDQRPTGLVGRNGMGKSVLARILAGTLPPTHGRCSRSGSVYYLAQQITPAPDATVASLAGVKTTLDALARIEAGSSDPQDFDAVGDAWDIRQRLQEALAAQGLEYATAQTPASALSGGQAMRVALIGVALAGADFLILDEPSNHLDRAQREALLAELRQWPGGLLVVSHDRQLLQTMARIVELSPLALRSYGGDYAFYAATKANEQQAAAAQLAHSKHERQRQGRALREQQERQVRRQVQGERQGKDSNQAKILLDRQKQRSEGSAGKLHQQHAAIRERLDAQVRAAAHAVAEAAPIAVHALPIAQNATRRVATLRGLELPFVPTRRPGLDLTLQGAQRIGVVGPNGCGKSTLLKVLAGQLQPAAGTSEVTVPTVYLDQRLATLQPDRTVLDQLRAVNRTAAEGDLRMRLAHLDLDAARITRPSGALSGGERLKAALACAFYADPPAQLLLLDEPSNHLDLPSSQALEAMLCGYAGALVVVSHDDVFMDHLQLTERLVMTDQGWRLEPW